MKLVITSTEAGLDAPVDPRFGRCAYIIVYDTETLQWQAHANPGASAMGGAGSQVAQFAASQGADAVISGDFGPNAHDALAVAGIKMYLLGPSQTAWDAIANLGSGKLQQVPTAAGSGRRGG